MTALSRAVHRTMQSLYARCSHAAMTTTATSTNERLDKINAMFAEARLLLQDANEAFGTTYFEEEYQDAQKATNETLNAFNQLCNSLTGEERSKVLAANKPKMAQLAEELKVLTDTLIHDDH